MIQIEPRQQKQSLVVIIAEIFLYLGITLVSMFLFVAMSAVASVFIFNIPLEELLSRDYDAYTTVHVNALKFIQAFTTIGAFLIPAFVIARIVSKKPFAFMGMRQSMPLIGIAGTILAWFFFYPLLAWIITVNQQMHFPEFLQGWEESLRESEERIARLTQVFLQMPTFTDFIINILIIAVLAALAEEFFFRGVVQRLFHGWTRNIHLGIWISAVIFSLIHMQFFGFFPRLILGALFGYLFYWSGSIWIAVLAHFVNNFIAVLVAFLSQKGLIDLNIEEIPDLPWYLVVFSVFTTTLLLFLLYNYFKSRNLRTTSEEPPVVPGKADDNWVKVFATNELHKAEIIIGLLGSNNIQGVTVNKKDSSYNFGDIEVYVAMHDAAAAIKVIEEYQP